VSDRRNQGGHLMEVRALAADPAQVEGHLQRPLPVPGNGPGLCWRTCLARDGDSARRQIALGRPQKGAVAGRFGVARRLGPPPDDCAAHPVDCDLRPDAQVTGYLRHQGDRLLYDRRGGSAGQGYDLNAHGYAGQQDLPLRGQLGGREVIGLFQIRHRPGLVGQPHTIDPDIDSQGIGHRHGRLDSACRIKASHAVDDGHARRKCHFPDPQADQAIGYIGRQGAVACTGAGGRADRPPVGPAGFRTMHGRCHRLKPFRPAG